MIEQQIYTRISGVRDSGGFGTVARSAGVSDSDLSAFESLCSYNVPYKMIDSAHPENNPEVRFLAVKDRYAVIGRSVYRTDEGRSTFLTHNYIVDIREQPELFLNVPALVAAEGFLSEPPSSSELPALERVPAPDIKTSFFDKDAVFYRTGLNDGLFAALISSLFSAISSSRKLFISLPCATNEIDRNARDVMRLLFAAMPPQLRSEMSYTTYFSEGSTNSGIRIYFVDSSLLPESGTITRIGDRSTRFDCVFDLKNARIQNAQSGRDSMYVSYVLKNLCTRDSNESLFSDITSLFSGLSEALPDANSRRDFISNILIYDLIALAESAVRDKNRYDKGVSLSGGISGLLELFCRLCANGGPAADFAAETLGCYARELEGRAAAKNSAVPDKRVLSLVCRLAECAEYLDACSAVVSAAAAVALNESDSAMLRMLSHVKAENDALYVHVLSDRLPKDDRLCDGYLDCCLAEADDYPLLFSFFLRQRACYPAITEHPHFYGLFLRRCAALQSPENCTLSSLTLVTRALEREASLSDDAKTLSVYNAITAAILGNADLSAASPDDFADISVSPAIKIGSQKAAETLACAGILRDICLSLRSGDSPDYTGIRPQLEALPVDAVLCEAQIRRALLSMLNKGFYASDARAFPMLLYCSSDVRDMFGYFSHCPDFLPDFFPYFAEHTVSSQRCRSFLSTAVQFYRDHPVAAENYRYIFEKYDLARENRSFASAGEPFKDRVLDIYLAGLPSAKRMIVSLATKHLRG